MQTSVKFSLPPKGVFKTNHATDDPLPYYYQPFTGWLYRRRIQNGLNLLSGRYQNVLEFGYGSGLLLPSLAQISENLHAIDIASEPDIVASSLSKLNLKAELRQCNIIQAQYPAGFFDLIVAFSVFEHICSPDDILKEMHRILKPTGQVLVGMPRVDRWMERLFIIIGFPKIKDHHVKTHQEFVAHTSTYFQIIKKNHMPNFIPDFYGIYFNKLFTKKES
jgi:2-polyprenyl-3-methyl-5-hydroxy-6-metoxy-1,4-benzoquinol methylase